jgi:hypothetical protein
MNVPVRVAAFTATLVAMGGAAAAVGGSVGPLDGAVPADHGQHPARDGAHGAEHGAEKPTVRTPAGLQVSEQGHTLRLLRDRYRPSPRSELRFQVLDERGEAVTRFETSHGRPLHLIVVRRDLGSFQHVHPEMSPDGTWSVEVDLAEAGTYRAFVDFQPVGMESGLTLGQDLFVPGRSVPQPLPAPAATAEVDGYDVELAGTLVPGETSRLTLTVTRDGEPVTDLQPYLEAYGHLVALRAGDLAYLHVHPDGAPGDGMTQPGPEVTFYAEVPSAGAYRLFLDFKHGDEVRTAAFTAVAGAAAEAGAAPAPSEPADPAHDAAHAH